MLPISWCLLDYPFHLLSSYLKMIPKSKETVWYILVLLSCRILASIVILGKACDLIDHHEQLKKYSAASSPHKTSVASTTSEMTTAPSATAAATPSSPSNGGTGNKANNVSAVDEVFVANHINHNHDMTKEAQKTPIPSTPSPTKNDTRGNVEAEEAAGEKASTTIPMASASEVNLNLLESKLQSIPSGTAIHMSPPAPLSSMMISSEDNLDPIGT